MSSQVTHYSLGARRNGTPLFYAGWAGFATFGALAYMGGHADLSYVVFHVLVASAFCIWYFTTNGRAVLIAGAALGTLFLLQTCLFLFSDIFLSEGTPMQTTLGDALGVGAAGLIMTGAVLSYRRRPQKS